MSPEPRRTPVPDILLERYLLSELPEAQMAEMTRRLNQDEDLRAQLETMRRSDSEILERHPPRLMRRRIESKLDGRKLVQSSREVFHRRWLVKTALGAAAFLMLMMLPLRLWLGPRNEESPPTERVKGLSPRLVLFRKTEDGSERLEDGAAAGSGDLIRIAYQAVESSYGIIFSVDGRGAITRHLPLEGERASPLQRDGLILLDTSYELDDAPSWERFYLVTGNEPFEVAPVMRAAQRVEMDRPLGQPERLELPESLSQFVVTLEKGVSR
jgi:hypothetical protein